MLNTHPLRTLTRATARALAWLSLSLAAPTCLAQHAPQNSTMPWSGPSMTHTPERPAYSLDLQHEYSLAELIDLAEQHNPDTRAAWQRAKAAAADLGISRSAFFPTLSAVAFGQSLQQGIILEDGFHIEDLGLLQYGLQLNYTIFDFGERQSQVNVSRARLLGANFAFNDTHRRILFGVSSAFFRVLEFQGREQAARSTLANAQTVQASAEARLNTGLGTLPDALEARSATAQADLQLQQEIGAEEIARGDLASLLELPPSTPIRVLPIERMEVPADIGDTIDELTTRAFKERPDLAQRVESLRSAEAQARGARAAYFPTLSFSGNNSHLRAWGLLDAAPSGSYASGRVWDARLSLNWTLFDGLRREAELSRAHAEQQAARAEVKVSEDQVENEVWAAFSNARTALRRRTAAVELLRASEESYSAALESYQAGVRTLIDLVSAQRTLAVAQSEDVSSRAGVLIALSNLAFRTGDILTTARPRRTP